MNEEQKEIIKNLYKDTEVFTNEENTAFWQGMIEPEKIFNEGDFC